MKNPDLVPAHMPAGSIVEPESVGLRASGLQRIGARLTHDVEQGAVAGAVVLVARRQQWAYFEAFGFQDREHGIPMRTDSIFRIASMTKPIVAVAALMLMEQGELALIEPIESYLPEFKNMQVGVETVDGDGRRHLLQEPVHRPITVQDLFRHTSGLTTALVGGSLIKRQYQDSNLRDDQQTLAQMVGKLAKIPLVHQPGTTFEYGMSTDVLGRIIEVVSRIDLNRYVVERIAQPLGLTDTSFILEAQSRSRLALPQSDPNGRALLPSYNPAKPPKLFSGGTGLLSTAADYARFSQMLLNGGELQGVRLLSRKTVELMLSDHLPPGAKYGPNTVDLGVPAPLPELGQSYGLGVGVRTHQGRSSVPGSVGDFYWGGAIGTYFWADPQEQLIAILMMQDLDGIKRTRYRSMLRSMVYHALNE
jgi:CubicO group peptidase (beta-lactamase class C family)